MISLKPDYVVERFIELDPATLVTDGIQAVIFDLDNTLWAADTAWLDPGAEEALAAWLNTFPGRVAVVTNKLRHRDAVKLRTLMERMPIIGLISGPLLKPLPFAIQRAITLLGTTPSHTLMVGDFYLADIIGGKLAGTKTALTSPMGRDEGIVANLVRPIDTWAAARFRALPQGN